MKAPRAIARLSQVFLVLLSIVTAEDHLFERLLNTLWTVLSIGLVNLSIVTLMFVYFGRASSGNLDHADWDLDDLPEVPADPNTPLPEALATLRRVCC